MDLGAAGGAKIRNVSGKVLGDQAGRPPLWALGRDGNASNPSFYSGDHEFNMAAAAAEAHKPIPPI
jgi:hypothetical protein